MKLSVSLKGEVLAVPCGRGTDKVRTLGDVALERYAKLKSAGKPIEEKVLEIRKTNGGAILDQDDVIKEVLDDNDFVTIVLTDDKDSYFSYNLMENPHSKLNGSREHASELLTVDGFCLSTRDVMDLGKGVYKLKLCPDAVERVVKARELIDMIIKEGKVVYGITTGFGKFANVVIPVEDLTELQENLIRSHAAGVGNPLNAEQVRRFMALRINVLAKGYSGISLPVLQQFIAAFNANCLPWIPEQGTVGASGDLAPLAHMALGLMGEGKMWSPETGWGESKQVLESHKLKPIKLGAKEGLALINGTQFITALGVEALERATTVCDAANAIAALSLEVLKGTTKAFDEDIHRARPHKGQMKVAGYLRALLHSDVHRSEIAESHRFCNRVQDAYTLRCCPQVHGIIYDTLDFVKNILTVEINSGTDNPAENLEAFYQIGRLDEYNWLSAVSYDLLMVFADRGEIISGGNFHGEYPAKALDYLAIGIHELAGMSERRTERLVNPAYSELPAFLVSNGGLNSGMMLAHVTSAALVSENKVLCHPSSVDSLTTSAGTEDHVSMGGWAARKAIKVVENVERVLAIELIAATHAIEFLRPLKTTQPLEEVYDLVRTVVKPWDKDRFMAPDIEAVTNLLREGKVWNLIKPHIDKAAELSTIDLAIDSPTSFSSVSNGFSSKRRKMC